MPQSAPRPARTALALLFALAAALWPGVGPALGPPANGVPAALQLGARPVAAGDEWCENDPLVIVVTPRGLQVPVHVTNYGLGAQYLPQVQQAAITYSVAPSPKGTPGTLVTFEVLVPRGPDAKGKPVVEFPTRSVISSLENGAGFVYARAEGKAGKVMKMEFTLPVP